MVLEGQVGAAGIVLGPFVLHEVIGRAGMGVVWSGTHVEQGAPVAVKVLTLEGSKDPLFLASLRNEVRGVAGLDHPGVVRVYDQGTVPRSVAESSDGELSAGSPYLVMEMLEGGTLLPLCGRMGWTQIWQVLAQILSGLAHAHARSVIHRDIKPSNILLRRKGAGVTLVDFGLARAGDRERGGSAFLDLGTPGYMAPEQIRRQFRDIGPWTDLYAVGCVATALVSARPPFVGDSAEAVLLAHLNQPIPALNPLMPVPDGFEAWVERLLSKSHHLRFERAADAILALMRLVDEEEENVEVLLAPLESGSSLMGTSTTSLQPLGEIRDGPLLVASDTAVMDPDFRSSLGGRAAPAPMPELPPPLILCDRPARPPVPSDWRNAEPERRPLRLLGTGLGIFGLRDLPVIGREAEQDLLWAQLEGTIESQRGGLAIISGDEGSGRSPLARWLTRRAHQAGLAEIYWVTVEPEASAAAVLRPLCHQVLRTLDMDRSSTRTRVQQQQGLLGSTDPGEIDALVSVLGPYPGDPGHSDVAFERAKARYVLVRRLLQRRSVLRPVILVLDMANQSEDAIAFARHLLRAQDYAPHPIMVVITVGGHGLSSDGQQMLQELSGHEGVQSMALGPLSTEGREVLVREILGLNRDLAAMVARRSGGNPQFAVQLVGDWVQKGLLEVGPSGFQMRSGVRPEIPADLQAMWERRLTAVISSERDVRGLELAAQMGLEVEAETWQAACSVAGLTPDWELVDQLLSAQLAMPGPTFRSWRFSHYLLADALRRRADFGGRARGHHAAAAQVLLSRGVALELPRLGRHQAGAGQLDAATATLLAGAKGCVSRAEWNSAWALLREREEILSKLGVPHSDGRWADGWLLRAESVRVGSDLDVCVSMYRKVLASVGETAPQAAQAWVGLGREARIRGDHPSAREFLGRADQLYSGPELGRVPLLIQIGILAAVFGDTHRAKEVYGEALGIATAAGDGDSIQDVQYHMAALYRRLGDEASARAALASVHDWCEAQGRRERVAQCANDMAEMDRLHGDMDAAIEGYRKSLRLYEAVGARQAYVARINLGIIAAERGHTVEAREHLGLVVPMLQRMKLRGIEGLAHLVMALVEAHDERWEACELALSQGVAQLKQTSFVDLDVARALEQTGEVALAAGKVDCARTALDLSAEYWEVLEREEEAARVADLLAEIHQIS